jgi:carboxypeptidase Q
MKIRVGMAVVALAGLSLAWSAMLRADDRPKGPEEDGTKPALTRIAGEGFLNSHAYQYLTELSDDIGARVTGSPAERKAEEWSAAKMKAIGLENVHLEKYKIWKGWTRGTAEAQLLLPTPHKLHVDAMGWTGSTVMGGAEGDVVPVNLFDIDEEIKNVARLKGKIVLVTQSGKAEEELHAVVCDFWRFSKGGA